MCAKNAPMRQEISLISNFHSIEIPFFCFLYYKVLYKDIFLAHLELFGALYNSLLLYTLLCFIRRTE